MKRRRPCENGGRDGSDAVTDPGRPELPEAAGGKVGVFP